MHNAIDEIYRNQRIFPIVYDARDIDFVIKCDAKVVLLGRVLNILNLKRLVNYLKENGKTVIVDIDLVNGLSSESYAVQYLAKEAGADGLISTHAETIINAKKEELITILKVFTYDEFSLDSALKVINYCKPKVIEALPGIAAPFFIKRIRQTTDTPVCVSGFMPGRIPEIIKLLNIGISGVHTGNKKLWEVDNSKLTESTDE